MAAPVELILAVEHGARYAHAAASSAVLGIASLVAYCVVYGAVAPRASTPWALLLSSLAFAMATALFALFTLPLGVEVTITAASIVAGTITLRRRLAAVPARGQGRQSDLLIARMVITAALVLALTAAARGLSPHLAGLLVPLPIITAVMAGFTHSRAGAAATAQLLAGLVQALVCFLVFFAVLAGVLTHVPDAAAFAIAAGLSLLSWGALTAATLWGAGARKPAIN